MKKIRTLVVDDEPLARARIVKLLEENEQIWLLGECKNGREALKSITTYKPDLVFLDIQMPDLNGFDVLSQPEIKQLPFIIFVTAYDQYALKAFDVHAVDYLLKPYDDDRFFQALDHACRQINLNKQASLHEKMVQLLDEHQAEEPINLYSLELKEKGRQVRLKIDDVLYFEADGNYLRLHTFEKCHLIRQTMQAIEEQVDPQQFLRIHRSLLVNTHFIENILYEGNNQFLICLKNGIRLSSGRSYREPIQQYLQEIK
ncbi:MAG TPA: LytTR family DNA-binding domain-containing protein [Saprospiraceae bacterium]|nr:LytTR family DNA-binding domain-containing protein [Saprospiraceae bacterium]HMQ84872.1 LytTR family DNA-binding domain-containing protein [Saprospiraceae bacterium]